MKIYKEIAPQLIFLGLLALVLRVVYFVLALSHQDIATLFESIPDTGVYWSVAQHLVDFDPRGDYWLFFVGPGYGFVLASLYKLFGGSYYPFYILNIILGSLAPIFVYLFSLELLKNKRISFIAGLITALSFTSISLSCNVLTDQPFFTMFAATLYLYTKAINSGETKWFVWAGIIAGVSIYMRSVGMFWFAIFPILPFFITLPDIVKSKMKLFQKACITSGIILLMIFCWSATNFVKHDVFTFGGNGARAARIRLAALAESNNTDKTYEEVSIEWNSADSEYYGDGPLSMGQFYERNNEQFFIFLKDHPDWVIKEFFSNVKDNLLESNKFPITQIPRFTPIWQKMNSINGKWLALVTALLSILSLFILLFKKKRTVWIILGVTYFYFLFINGFTMWQGSRLQYPMEIAYSILISYLLYETYSYVRIKLIKP